MKRLTFDGLFCDISKCQETPGGSFCEDGACSQRKVWERLKEYEDKEEQGILEALEEAKHQVDVLQYYKNYRDRLERAEKALRGGAE